MPVADLKLAIRREALARRDAVEPQYRAIAAVLISQADLPFAPRQGLVVSGFWPMRSEIDSRPLMARLMEEGCRLALPRVEDRVLVFREWRIGDPLEPGSFGTSVPALTSEALVPQVMLVPLAAFDCRGARIGYGRGFYDQAIARFSRERSLLTIGLAYAAQEVAEVPMERHDRFLDYVLTERGYAAGQRPAPAQGR
jgi:5-formyltetrahydrofolate cyclo-ligase